MSNVWVSLPFCWRVLMYFSQPCQWWWHLGSRSMEGYVSYIRYDFGSKERIATPIGQSASYSGGCILIIVQTHTSSTNRRRYVSPHIHSLSYLFTLTLVPVLLLVDRTLEQRVDVQVSVRHLENEVSFFYFHLFLCFMPSSCTFKFSQGWHDNWKHINVLGVLGAILSCQQLMYFCCKFRPTLTQFITAVTKVRLLRSRIVELDDEISQNSGSAE